MEAEVGWRVLGGGGMAPPSAPPLHPSPVALRPAILASSADPLPPALPCPSEPHNHPEITCRGRQGLPSTGCPSLLGSLPLSDPRWPQQRPDRRMDSPGGLVTGSGSPHSLLSRVTPLRPACHHPPSGPSGARAPVSVRSCLRAQWAGASGCPSARSALGAGWGDGVGVAPLAPHPAEGRMRLDSGSTQPAPSL